MTEVMRVCFRHRYPELLAKGLVDESTRIIDKEDLDFYTSKNLPYKQIKKGLGLEPDDIKRLRELERSLLASDRERALDGLGPGSDGEPESTEDAADSDVAEFRTPKAAIFMYADSTGSAALHVALATRWCREKGIEACPPMIGGSVDPSGVGHNLRTAIAPLGDMDATMLIIWTDQSIPDDELEWLRSYCAGRHIDIVPIGDMASLWRGIRWGRNDIEPKRGKWMELRWAHIPVTVDGVCRTTRVLNVEDAMDCARLGIPYWAVGECIGVSWRGMVKALQSESMLEDYNEAYCEAINYHSDCETTVSGESVSPVNSEGGAQIAEVSELQSPMRAPSDTPSVAPPSEFRPEVTDEEVSPVNSEGGAQIAEVSELQPPIDTPSVEAPETPTEDVHRDTPRRAPSVEAPAVIEMGFPMMTVSGAKGVVSTINDGTAPDEDLWTPVADGFTVDTYRLSLMARDGRVYYCVGVACEVIKAVYTPAKQIIYFDRMGRVYALDGFLTLRLADWSAVEVPIVSDVPVNTKRWIA